MLQKQGRLKEDAASSGNFPVDHFQPGENLGASRENQSSRKICLFSKNIKNIFPTDKNCTCMFKLYQPIFDRVLENTINPAVLHGNI